MSLYTFIADFRGGTYCTQVNAQNIHLAVQQWIVNLKKEKHEINGLGESTIEELSGQSKETDSMPMALKGLLNVWHALYLTESGSFFINIVRTDPND